MPTSSTCALSTVIYSCWRHSVAMEGLLEPRDAVGTLGEAEGAGRFSYRPRHRCRLLHHQRQAATRNCQRSRVHRAKTGVSSRADRLPASQQGDVKEVATVSSAASAAIGPPIGKTRIASRPNSWSPSGAPEHQTDAVITAQRAPCFGSNCWLACCSCRRLLLLLLLRAEASGPCQGSSGLCWGLGALLRCSPALPSRPSACLGTVAAAEPGQGRSEQQRRLSCLQSALGRIKLLRSAEPGSAASVCASDSQAHSTVFPPCGHSSRWWPCCCGCPASG